MDITPQNLLDPSFLLGCVTLGCAAAFLIAGLRSPNRESGHDRR